jgi:hypothetical protein
MTTAPSSRPDLFVVRIADRVRREVVLARFIGKLAVDQGLRELRHRLVPAEDAPTPAVPTTAPTPATPDSSVRIEPSVAVDELALADYDHLSSAQIVAKLGGLEPSERAEIGAYERTHRHRRTILGKLEQLDAT